ncbi:conserved exported hypothetical protein [Streptomyces murinus]
MPSARTVTAVVVGAVLLSACVYSGVRFADSINHDFAGGAPAPSPNSTWLPASYGTLSPSQYHYGKAVAQSAGKDVIAYVPQHHPHGVLTVPFTITNHGDRPYRYDITVMVTGAIDPGVPQSAHISSDGMLPPSTTMATEINFESRDEVPVQDINVRIANIDKRGPST